MNRPTWGILLLLAVLAAVSGCSSETKTEGDSKGSASSKGDATAGDATGGTASSQSTHLLSENVEKRTSLEGRWILVFFEKNSGLEVPAVLLDISKSSKDPANLRLVVKGYGGMLTNPRVKQSAVTRDTLHLNMEMTVQTMSQGRPSGHQTKPLDVRVDLRDGYARGSAEFTPMDTSVVMMVPTKLDSIQSLRPQQLPEAADLQIPKDSQPTQEQIIEKMAAFPKAHPDSPMAIDIYPFLFRAAAERNLDEAALNAEADQYATAAARWSPRLEFKARIDVAAALCAIGYMPQVALKQVDIAMGKLTEETIPIWKTTLQDFRNAAISSQALNQIKTGTAAEKAKAADILRTGEKEHPYNPLVVYQLARYDEEQGRKEQALRGFAEVVVLPLFDALLSETLKNEKQNPPKQTAEALWKDLHGGKLDGFDAYLDKVYDESMPKGHIKRVEPRAPQSDNRVVLCELFTGANCGPCVAADIAFSQLLKTYAPTEVIALQYHQHIPQPDPLANSDSEQRFHFYFPERGGTPTFTIAGAPAQRGGLLHQVGDVYREIRELINVMLQRKTSVQIHLKAEPKGEAVAVTAETEGSFSSSDPVRLRLVLAEERVAMRGSNGIREHEMVVRSMPGGPAGIDIKDGKLKYQTTIDLKVVKRQLDDYLRAFEEQQKTIFPKKPLELSHLHLVAFVQNEQTKEVYQAATTPFPSGPAPAAPKSQASALKSNGQAGAVSKAAP
jgi:hypothetical protein